MKLKYKVGDKVRFIKGATYDSLDLCEKIGSGLVTILEVDRHSPNLCRFQRKNGGQWWVPSSKFRKKARKSMKELIEEKQ